MEPPKMQQNQLHNYGYAQANLLVNPGFEIWQRGTAAFTADDIFTADEWKVNRHISDTLQIDDESTTIVAGTLSLKATKTGTNDVAYIRQGVENYKSLEGQTVTFSMWVNANVASGARLVLQDYVSSEEVEYSAYHSGSGEWEQLTVTKTIRTGLASYGSFPHSFGMAVGLQLADKAVTAYIDGASLVLGNFPQGVPFIPLNPAEDRGRCERFYEAGKQDFQHISIRRVNASTMRTRIANRFRGGKYATPTVSITFGQINLFEDAATGSTNTTNDEANWDKTVTPSQDGYTLKTDRSSVIASRSSMHIDYDFTAEVT